MGTPQQGRMGCDHASRILIRLELSVEHPFALSLSKGITLGFDKLRANGYLNYLSAGSIAW
ncbi:MAG: hypothetical protein B7Y40_09370 [Gammaproteobacteria bacterium 28-57-27]|nr:MAG: hypothetical protein B7Y40_09370 [Gammaproteobacteria bacterium 28-57-27]